MFERIFFFSYGMKIQLKLHGDRNTLRSLEIELTDEMLYFFLLFIIQCFRTTSFVSETRTSLFTYYIHYIFDCECELYVAKDESMNY